MFQWLNQLITLFLTVDFFLRLRIITRLLAVDTTGNVGVLSDEVSAITSDVIAPTKVMGLNATTISSNRIDLSWTTGTEPDLAHYNVYRGTTAGFPVTPGTDTPLAQPVANSVL